MSERPKDAIKWLELFLYHRDHAKERARELLAYISYLQAELERAKEELRLDWRVWLKEAMERRATMDEVQLQILHWAEHFEQLEKDSKRLDKLLQAMGETGIIVRNHDGTWYVDTLDQRELADGTNPIEAIDKLEEPHE